MVVAEYTVDDTMPSKPFGATNHVRDVSVPSIDGWVAGA
jgi:hypothetical protein